jgi:protein involved in polysaccharide export with SLBB domain
MPENFSGGSLMKSRRFLKLFLFVLGLSACATTVKNPVLLNTPEQRQPTVKEYRIQTGDQLEVKFFYNPELNEQVVVRPDGRISLQLANDTVAAGLTPSALTELLKKKYSTEIDKPEITIIVRTFTSQRVFVDGEVNRAGLVALTEPMTVLQSISQAGGVKDTALLYGVIVIRRTADNKLVTTQLNLENAIDNTDVSQDIPLMANDIVYVPKTTIANINVWVDQYIRKNIPLSAGVTYGVNY